MGKIIDLRARAAPVRWTIQVGDCEDFIQCRYLTESITMSAPHWKVFIMASTVDHVQMLIEKAKEQMAIHNKAAR